MSKKTVALLELSGQQSQFADREVRDTLLFAQRYLQYQFPIVDTSGDVATTLSLLDQYYQQGYRIFIGFNRSTLLQSVSDWFLSHPDAIGISLLSTAPSLKSISNVIRLSPRGSYTVGPYIDWMKRYQNVVIIYQRDELAARETVNDIGSYANMIIPYERSTIRDTLNQIRDLSRTRTTLIIPYLVSNLYEFNTLAQEYVKNTPINLLEDVSSEPPNLTRLTTQSGYNVYDGRYFHMSVSIPSSPLLEQISSQIGESFSLNGYDAVLIAKTLASGKSISGLQGLTGEIRLDQYNDRSVLPYDFTMFTQSDGWIHVDTILGRETD